MIDINATILNTLKQSTCFGIAHSDEAPECQMCDVKAQCKAKIQGADLPTPKSRPVSTATAKPAEEKPKAKKPAKKTEKPKEKAKSAPKTTAKPKPASKPKSNSNIDWKAKQLDELKEMAKEKNVEWKEYGNDNITRMRLVMELKKHY